MKNLKTKEGKLKNKNGITLIALVVTIIILLILAGISIAMLTGQNGILNRASEAKRVSGTAQTDEQVKIAVGGAIAKGLGTISYNDLKEELDERFDEYSLTPAGESESWTLEVNGLQYTITGTGVVERVGESLADNTSGNSGNSGNSGETGNSGNSGNTGEQGGTGGETNTPDDPSGEDVQGDGDDVTPLEYYTPMSIEASTGNYAGILYEVQNPSGDERAEDNTSTAKVITGNSITNSNLKNNAKIKEVRQGDVPIPDGFYYVGGTKDTGLVISSVVNDDLGNTKGGNQFVWVPVPDVIYKATDNKTPQNSIYSQSNNFVSSTKYREPDIVSDYDSESQNYLKDIGFKKIVDGSEVSDVDAFKTEMQTSYNAMVASVNKYKGFYVGRYELGIEGTEKTAVSKNANTNSGVTTAAANNSDTYRWYGLYKKCKSAYQETDTNSSVVSSMIWGSQYDAMMNWMASTGKKVASKNESKRNTSQTTGSEVEDVINKIYDIYGCHLEWTLEASCTYHRASRRRHFRIRLLRLPSGSLRLLPGVDRLRLQWFSRQLQWFSPCTLHKVGLGACGDK